MRETTKERAHGKWRSILPKLGIDKKFLTGRKMPCPICGGRDRFRFDDRRKDGNYFCNQCGAGEGLKLVMKFRGWGFATAAAEIDKVLGYRYHPVNEHKHCCSSAEEERAHRAAIAFFAKQPDFHEQTTTQILLDESIPFDEAMELIAARQLRGIRDSEPVKSIRDAALWLRRYYPRRLESWLQSHDPMVREWLSKQT